MSDRAGENAMNSHRTSPASATRRLLWACLVCGWSTCFVGCAGQQARRTPSAGTIAERKAVLDEALSPRRRAETYAAGAAKLEQDGFPRDAAEQYAKARSVDPSLPGIAHRLAVLYDREENFEKAAPEYAAALAERPDDADVRNDYGYFRLRQGAFDEAERSLRQALELAPEHAAARGNLAQLLAETGREAEALAIYERLVGPAAARSNVGLILARRGRTPEARRHLEAAVALEPTLRPARSALDHLSRTAGEPPPMLAAGPSGAASADPTAADRRLR